MHKIKQALYVVVATIFAVVPLAVSAVDPTSNGFNVADTKTAAKGLNNESIFAIISRLMNWLLGLVGVLAVIAFVISGILYLTAAGNEEQAEKAKEVMLYAIIGLVVALIGLVVVNAVAGLTGAAGGAAY